MKKLHILILLLTVCAVGCKKSFLLDVPDCDYNARIVIDYSQENTVSYNSMADYASVVDLYVFDASRTLCYTNRINETDGNRNFVAKPTLAAGKYSVIALANKSGLSVLNEAVIGTTKLDNVLLTLSTTDRSDRLYYGYRSFSVKDDNISNVRVDMVHSHCVINFRISWQSNPPPMGNYKALMSNVPSAYNFTPEYIYTNPNRCENYNAAVHDDFNIWPGNVKQHIPFVRQDMNIINHSLLLPRNVDGEINGQFVMYRIRNQTQPTMSLHTTTVGLEEQIMKDINLQKYFVDGGYDLDRTLKQEYLIEIVIDGNKVFVFESTVSDWQEGGTIF